MTSDRSQPEVHSNSCSLNKISAVLWSLTEEQHADMTPVLKF